MLSISIGLTTQTQRKVRFTLSSNGSTSRITYEHNYTFGKKKAKRMVSFLISDNAPTYADDTVLIMRQDGKMMFGICDKGDFTLTEFFLEDAGCIYDMWWAKVPHEGRRMHDTNFKLPIPVAAFDGITQFEPMPDGLVRYSDSELSNMWLGYRPEAPKMAVLSHALSDRIKRYHTYCSTVSRRLDYTAVLDLLRMSNDHLQ